MSLYNDIIYTSLLHLYTNIPLQDDSYMVMNSDSIYSKDILEIKHMCLHTMQKLRDTVIAISQLFAIAYKSLRADEVHGSIKLLENPIRCFLKVIYHIKDENELEIKQIIRDHVKNIYQTELAMLELLRDKQLCSLENRCHSAP